jgi:hypothetical protein
MSAAFVATFIGAAGIFMLMHTQAAFSDMKQARKALQSRASGLWPLRVRDSMV